MSVRKKKFFFSTFLLEQSRKKESHSQKKKKLKTTYSKNKKKQNKHVSLEYARPARLALWLAAEVAIVGADVQEVVGSALALALLSKGALSLPAAVVASAASSFALLYVERLGVRHLEALFALFIGTMVSGVREREGEGEERRGRERVWCFFFLPSSSSSSYQKK